MQTAEAQKQWLRRYPEHVSSDWKQRGQNSLAVAFEMQRRWHAVSLTPLEVVPKLSHRLNELIDSSAWPHACTAIPIPQKLTARDSLVGLTTLVDAEPTIRTISSYRRRCIEMAPRVVALSFSPDATHIPGTSRVIADRPSRVYAPSGNGAVDETIQPDFSSCDTHGSAGYERQLVQGV